MPNKIKKPTLIERMTAPFRRTTVDSIDTKVIKEQITREQIINSMSTQEKIEAIDSIKLEEAKQVMRDISVTTNEEKVTFNTVVPDETDEKDLYDIYRQMDNDAVISAALDLFADNATQANTKTGHVISVESPDKNFQEEVNQFLWDIVKIDTEAWNYARAIAKYGKLVIDTKASNGGADWAFIELDKPELVTPLTYGQDLIKYFVVTTDSDETETEQDKTYRAYGYNTGTAGEARVEYRDRYIVGFNSRKHLGKMKIQSANVITKKDTTEELYIRTGKSYLEGIIDTWRMLSTLEDSMFITRLVKSKSFNVVTIDISDANTKQGKEMVESVKRAIRGAESIDKTAERYNNRTSPIPADDFVYISKKGEKGVVTIEQVGGEVGTQDLSDIDYYRNKLFAGLGVLKAYLGFEETMPGGLGGDATLTMLDERFTRKVKRLRQSLADVATQIVEYYYLNSSTVRDLENMPEFEIVMGKISSQEEAANRAELMENFNIANEFLNLTSAFPEKVNEDKLFNHIFNTILGVDPALFDNTPETKELEVRATQLGLQETLLERSRFQRNRPKRRKALNEDRSFPVLTGTIEELLSKAPLTEILKEWTIQLEDKGVITTLHSALDNRNLRQSLTEATYKDLKQRTQILDPERIKRSKKITGKYLGLDEDLFITFQMTAEDPAKNRAEGKPTSYESKVHLKALLDIIKARRAGETDLKLLRDAVADDVAVACDCPASKYWGQQFNGTQDGYSIVQNNIYPTRNVQYQVICKHVATMLTLLPFWTNTIVRDLRQKGYLTQSNLHKNKELIPQEQKPLTREPVLEEPEVKDNKPVKTKVIKKDKPEDKNEKENEDKLKELADKAPKTRKKKIEVKEDIKETGEEN